LSIEGYYEKNDAYVVPVRMWGDTPSLAHFWKRVPAPN
jgi:hypothetical protein